MSRIVDAVGRVRGARPWRFAPVTRAEADRQRFEPGETVFARAVQPVDATDAEPALAI